MKRMAASVPLVIGLAACTVLVPSPRAATPPATFEPLVLTESVDAPPARHEVLQLPAGSYVMQWEARIPTRPGGDTCAVAIDMRNQEGESVMEDAVSEVLDRPTAGHAMMPDLPGGEYVLSVDIGCPFMVSLTLLNAQRSD